MIETSRKADELLADLQVMPFPTVQQYADALGIFTSPTSPLRGILKTVVDNTTLTFNRSNALTVANVISGTGTVVQAGAGTTTLTGANTYSGTTTITAGTLQVGSGGTTGQLGTGAVVDDGTLAINRSNAITVANAISGSGAPGTVRRTISAARSGSGNSIQW